MHRDESDKYRSRRTWLRLIYLAWAMAWYVLTGFGRLGQGRVVVLCYHGVNMRQRNRFVKQIRRIAGRAVGIPDLAQVTSESSGLPLVCVTFDDGFADLQPL